MPLCGLASTCTHCQDHKVRCSHTGGHAKRKAEGGQGGLVAKKLKRSENQTEEQGLEEQKVLALERIAAQLERVSNRLERMGGKVRLSNDLTALDYMRDMEFESIDWMHRDWLTELAAWSGELDIEKKWREEKGGKGGKV